MRACLNPISRYHEKTSTRNFVAKNKRLVFVLGPDFLDQLSRPPILSTELLQSLKTDKSRERSKREQDHKRIREEIQSAQKFTQVHKQTSRMV